LNGWFGAIGMDFYPTRPHHQFRNGTRCFTKPGKAQRGDLFMSLIHTCELNDVNPFEYLTELLRHAAELKQKPSAWMPWNYWATLATSATA
jgi:hypothetical protein